MGVNATKVDDCTPINQCESTRPCPAGTSCEYTGPDTYVCVCPILPGVNTQVVPGCVTVLNTVLVRLMIAFAAFDADEETHFRETFAAGLYVRPEQIDVLAKSPGSTLVEFRVLPLENGGAVIDHSALEGRLKVLSVNASFVEELGYPFTDIEIREPSDGDSGPGAVAAVVIVPIVVVAGLIGLAVYMRRKRTAVKKVEKSFDMAMTHHSAPDGDSTASGPGSSHVIGKQPLSKGGKGGKGVPRASSNVSAFSRLDESSDEEGGNSSDGGKSAGDGAAVAAEAGTADVVAPSTADGDAALAAVASTTPTATTASAPAGAPALEKGVLKLDAPAADTKGAQATASPATARGRSNKDSLKPAANADADVPSPQKGLLSYPDGERAYDMGATFAMQNDDEDVDAGPEAGFVDIMDSSFV